MRKLSFLLPCAVAASISMQTSMAVAACDVGVVNVQNSIAEMKATKKFNADTEKKHGPEAKRIENLVKELQKMEGTLKTLKGTELRTKQTEFEQKAIQYKSSLAQHQKTLQAGQQAYLDKISPDLQKALAALAKDKKVSVIVNRAAAVYVADECDFTKDLTKKIDGIK